MPQNMESHRLEEEYSLDEMIDKIKNVDIIITEGYKSQDKPKLEIFRKDISKEIYSKKEDLFGVITDTKLDIDVAQFSFSQIEEVVDLIEGKFLQGKIE